MHQRRFEKKTIYGYTKLHLLDCFPKLHSYYGMKLHVLAQRRRGSLTFPVRAFVSTASQHDLSAAKEIFQNNVFSGFTLLADKAYVDAQWTDSLLQNGTRLLSPSKRKRGKAPALPGGDIRDTSSRSGCPRYAFCSATFAADACKAVQWFENTAASTRADFVDYA